MNKRAFLLTSSTWLGLGTAMAASCTGSPKPSPSAPYGTGTHPDGPLPPSQADWHALLGQAFATHTALGQPCTLSLVRVQDATVACPRLSQFTLHFEGPKHRPLHAGLHWLRHPHSGQALALDLQALPPGSRRAYLAHFSLLG